MSAIAIESPQRWFFAGLICLGLLLGLAFQGTRGLWSPDEGRYVDGALQMLDSGNYLVPGYSPDEVNLSKPPATYWSIAASMKVFGRNTWAARLPFALFYLATILTLYGAGKLLIPEKPWLPGLVYGCSALPFIAANIVTTDSLLALCEAVAMYGFLKFAFGSPRYDSRKSLLLMWAGWGAAFLVKGPPGLLPLLAIIPFMAIRDGWRSVGKLLTFGGIALFLLIGLSWYVIVVIRIPGTMHYFIHGEIYDRLFTATQHRNAGPVRWAVVYLPTILLGSAPWWPSLGRAFLAFRSPAKLQSDPNGRDSIQLLLALWFFVPFLVFCLAQSRLPLYLLPLFFPLALMIAFDLRGRMDLRKTTQRVGLGLWIAVLIAVKGGVAYAHVSVDNRAMARQLASAAGSTYSSVVFIEDTSFAYDVEENTPWGIRLYLGKPVYGVAWNSPKGEADLCHALQRSGSALVVIDRKLASQVSSGVLSSCATGVVTDLGKWKHRSLKLIRIGSAKSAS